MSARRSTWSALRSESKSAAAHGPILFIAAMMHHSVALSCDGSILEPTGCCPKAHGEGKAEGEWQHGWAGRPAGPAAQEHVAPGRAHFRH
eukprot:scaffold372254_cov22-Prasinocladus_malaysianus.AAC.1